MISDVGQLMSEQKQSSKNRTSEEISTMAYDEYLDYDELEAWIYHVSGKHDFNTEVFKIGETEEGRNIVGLHVGDKNHSSDKPKIFIECGIHAREWIAPAACRQFIHEILHNVGYPAEYNQAAADDQSAENERAGDPYTKEDV